MNFFLLIFGFYNNENIIVKRGSLFIFETKIQNSVGQIFPFIWYSTEINKKIFGYNPCDLIRQQNFSGSLFTRAFSTLQQNKNSSLDIMLGYKKLSNRFLLVKWITTVMVSFWLKIPKNRGIFGTTPKQHDNTMWMFRLRKRDSGERGYKTLNYLKCNWCQTEGPRQYIFLPLVYRSDEKSIKQKQTRGSSFKYMLFIQV